MERSSNFRGGRGVGRGRGRGGQAAGGRGRGSGAQRGGFGFQPQRHGEQGYAPPYPPPNEAVYHLQPPNGYPPHEMLHGKPGHSFPEQQQPFPPPFPLPHQHEMYRHPPQQQPPQRPHDPNRPQGYIEGTNGTPPGFRHQGMDTFHPHVAPPHQQFPHPPHPLHHHPRPHHHLPPPVPFQEPQGPEHLHENGRFAAHRPPVPPNAGPFFPPTADFAEAAHARQARYDPHVPGRDGPHGEWNHPPPRHLPWQYAPPEHQPFGGRLPAFVQQQRPPPMDQRHFPRDPNVPSQDRWQDGQDRQQHRGPPPSYVCHNCNKPGHWKQQCPLNETVNDRAGSGPEPLLEQRHSSGTRPEHQLAPAHSTKPKDPRKNGGSHSNAPSGGKVDTRRVAKDEPCEQPPLPGGPSPPPPSTLQSNETDAGSTQLHSQPDQRVWKCVPCMKSFFLASQYNAHVKTHKSCSACDFSACQRVVTAHFGTCHGQYSGEGLKEIVIDDQKFAVLVGNSAEDIAKWREDRRKKWLGMSRKPKSPLATVPVIGKRKLSVPSGDLEDGEVEEEGNAKAHVVLASSGTNLAALRSTALHHSKPDVQEPPVKKQRKNMLCKGFLHGRCRLDEANCKFTHDRSLFGCRAMMNKGSCSKGEHCLFSHDATVLSGQRERSVKASKEHATEQQWRSEKKSLLHKLLAKDVRLEQQKMLQIVHFLVERKFLRPLDGGDDVACAEEPVVHNEVAASDEASSGDDAEASESSSLTSTGAVKEEVSDDDTSDIGSSTEECDSALPSQVRKLSKVVDDGRAVPVVEESVDEEETSDSE
uniref:Nuclear fragile X mental retardation-interacting protein 1 n=1 Tax=Peronospora matthiolae TaxID=2874970 RepID=A0AAV1U1X0_9STRA